MLAEGGIGIRADMEDDLLNEEVTYEAKEAIDFLNSREKFWDQLELGSQNNRAGKEKQAKTMEGCPKSKVRDPRSLTF
mgnify:CR=1 FL=1